MEKKSSTYTYCTQNAYKILINDESTLLLINYY